MRASRELLYGDAPLSAFTSTEVSYPWKAFRHAAKAIEDGDGAAAVAMLLPIARDGTLEPRVRLEAWSVLRGLNVTPPPGDAARVEGVVVDVVMATGHDTLAAYADKSAVYINHAGSATYVLPGVAFTKEIEALLAASDLMYTKIGPWNGPRPELPTANGVVRISLLSALGLSFGQGPISVLAANSISSTVFTQATALLQKIVEFATK
jgi:hypothetical protein